ncbi:MAG: EscU/YscU/HrcU family type III secretion system export apparatus switch protein [Leptospiraceae bacterium]|nr:EscU/YscU/HrcU family type III secretion system export apparatus switch protein [Leptospiraceae bacterium]
MRPFNKIATAIGFDPQKDQAPRVLAQGRGLLAEKIQQQAESAGVHIVQDPALAELTAGLPLHSEIPENLYTVMAGILGMVMRMRQESRL